MAYLTLKWEGFKIKNYQHIKLLIALLGLLYWPGELFSQQNTNAAGGNAHGTGGTVSYSIGQLDYLNATGLGGTITDGLQQPYEIMIVSGIEDNDINLTYAIYPNPTADFVVLSVQNANTLSLTYALFDIEGKLLEKKEVNGSQTTIAMKDLANGIYFIKVLRKSTQVKIFKVIKNK